jgi:hypothetical protein
VSKTDPTKRDTDGDGYSDPSEISEGSNPTSASSVPNNLALLGTGILGTKETVEDGVETAGANAGGPSSINDGVLTTRVDTYGIGGAATASYVGVLWDAPLTTPVLRLEFNMATFFDGGWFGVNGVGPGSGSVLSAAEHLLEPVVQVTTNHGTSWVTVPHTSDYLDVVDQHPLPAVDFGEPTLVKSTFELTEPQTGIDGIRILGSEGGTASGGFLGVFELAVRGSGAPPVSTLQIGNVARTATGIQFEFDTQSGKNYVVQYTNAVRPTSWQTLTTITGDGTRKQVTDTVAEAQRFYRVNAP